MISALRDRLLVRRVIAERSDGGLYLPSERTTGGIEWAGSKTIRGDYTAEGIVVAVGSGPDAMEPREVAGLEYAIGIARQSSTWNHISEARLHDALTELLARRGAPGPDVRVGERIFWPSWARKWEVRLDVGRLDESGRPIGPEDLLQIQGEDVAAVERYVDALPMGAEVLDGGLVAYRADGPIPQRIPVIVPLRGRILVNHERLPDRIGALHVPEEAQKKTFWARVAAVGGGKILPDGRRAPIDLRVGDRVFLSEHGETRITIHGADNIIMRIDDVLAVDDETQSVEQIISRVGSDLARNVFPPPEAPR